MSPNTLTLRNTLTQQRHWPSGARLNLKSNHCCCRRNVSIKYQLWNRSLACQVSLWRARTHGLHDIWTFPLCFHAWEPAWARFWSFLLRGRRVKLAHRRTSWPSIFTHTAVNPPTCRQHVSSSLRIRSGSSQVNRKKKCNKKIKNILP